MSYDASFTPISPRVDPRLAYASTFWAVEMAQLRVAAAESRASANTSPFGSPRSSVYSPHGTPRTLSPRTTGKAASPGVTPRTVTPQTPRKSPYLGEDEDEAARLRPNLKLDLWNKMSLNSKRVMEVSDVDHLDGAKLAVYEACELTSKVVAELDPLTRFKVLVSQELDDGTIRAFIVLQNNSHPAGWITSRTAEGLPRMNLCARPLYVVAGTPLKVRRQFEETSTFVTQLHIGTRVHVVESRRTAEGKQRVSIVIFGEQEPIGWVTMTFPGGARTMREAHKKDDFRIRWASSCPRGKGTDVRQQSATSASARELSPRSAFHSRRSAARPMSAREVMSRTASVPALPLGRDQWQGAVKEVMESAARRLAQAPARSKWHGMFAKHKSLNNKEASVKDGNASTEADSAKRPSKSNAAKDAALWATWSANASHMAVETQANECLAQVGKFVSASSLQDVIQGLLQKADDEVAAQANQPLSVQIGVLLQNRKVDDVIAEWDPNSDGKMTKMEFRLNVRALALVKPPETKDVDVLFKEMDVNQNGKLDNNELKKALKKLQESVAGATAKEEAAKARADRYRAKAAAMNTVLTETAHAEKCAAALEVARKGTLGSQLGLMLNNKGYRAQDLAMRWDKSGSGQITKHQFMKEVTALGIEADSAAIEDLFDSLDADGSSALTINEIKGALKALQEEADGLKQSVRGLGLQYIQAFKVMRVQQAEYQLRKKVEEKEDAAEAARLKEEAELRAAVKAEEKAMKRAALEEKRAASEAERLAFEEKIQRRRGSVSS